VSEPGPSNTSVERAGALLRAVALGEVAEIDAAAVEAAREVVEQFRRRFLLPHLDLRDRLAQLAAETLPFGSSVTARWKRHDRIVEKLVRLPRHRLPQMQDVGGCRIVAHAPQIELDEVANAIKARWELLADDDYVASPRDTGYRARHLVVRHHDVAIEVQVRNALQDLWAEVYETLHRNTDLDRREQQVQRDIAILFVALSDLFLSIEAGTIQRDPVDELSDLLVRHSDSLAALKWTSPPGLPHDR
jgi:ppGpp synthetase/RelA/SpoT-type nucleotidyltranferase